MRTLPPFFCHDDWVISPAGIRLLFGERYRDEMVARWAERAVLLVMLGAALCAVVL